MRTRTPLAASLLLVPALFACGGKENVDTEEALRAARADSMAVAEKIYDATAFDSINWETAADRLSRGRVVWQFSCQKCHGAHGLGNGEAAEEWQIEMPVIVEEDWQYAGDVEGIHHRIFVGHEAGMPNWGLHGLKYRDIDAVTAYILTGLRGEELAAN